MEATVTTNSEEKTWEAAANGSKLWQINDVVFIVSDALTFSGFLAAYGFHDLNLLKHGHWLMKCLHFPFMHGVSAPMYYVVNDFYFDFSSVTMVWLLMLVIK
jgi:cytochrome c oxidase subunit 3